MRKNQNIAVDAVLAQQAQDKNNNVNKKVRRRRKNTKYTLKYI